MAENNESRIVKSAAEELEKDVFDELTPEAAEEDRKRSAEEASGEHSEITRPKKSKKEKSKAEKALKEFGVKEKGIKEVAPELTEKTEIESEREPEKLEEKLEDEPLEDIEEELEEEVGKSKKRQLKKEMMHKAQFEGNEEGESIAVKLQFLENPKTNSIFIGRKRSIYTKFGEEAALYIGKVEEEEQKEKKVLLDSMNPHVVFICGARGSGKSYLLGVISEELALKNPNVGVVVVDPVGVFWSMKFPNKDEKEVEQLAKFGLEPNGLKNLKVFIPQGVKSETPKNTYDALFSMKPSLLTSEDWCLTFGIDRFSPTGLLLDKALKKVETGFKTTEGAYFKSKKKDYSLDDLVLCLEKDGELNSRDKGYKQDSIRALVSRFEAAKSWGVFDEKGTPLSQLSREGQLTVIDTSFLDDTVTALVIGILSRRILAARKISTRKEAAQKFKEKDVNDLLELEIPPTWLFIDEAHTLIPSGNVKTPATSALVEYVKQGRRPGCSLVFATQQPSAIDTRVLSQLDVIVTHKLIFDDDIKAVIKRTPAIIPMKYKRSNFLKTIPIGVGVTGDRREETSRAFILRVRPRMSQHEGRDAETSDRSEKLSGKEIENLTAKMVYAKIEKEGKMDKETLEQVISTMNAKYRGIALLSNVLTLLEEHGCEIDPRSQDVLIPGRVIEKGGLEEPEAENEVQEFSEDHEKIEGVPSQIQEAIDKVQKAKEEGKILPSVVKLNAKNQNEMDTGDDADEKDEFEVELPSKNLSFPLLVDHQKIPIVLQKLARKNLFGLLGSREELQELKLKYVPVWRVDYHFYLNKSKTEFLPKTCFINSVSGEFLHFSNNKFIESAGLTEVTTLKPEEIKVLRNLDSSAKKSIKKLQVSTNLSEQALETILTHLASREYVKKIEEKDGNYYVLNRKLDLPPAPSHQLLDSLKKMKLVEVQNLEKLPEKYSKDQIYSMLGVLWPQVTITGISEVFRPIYSCRLADKKSGAIRLLQVDGFTGQQIE